MNGGPPLPPRILILGTGAMATTLGAHLARSEGAKVTLAGTWAAALEAVNRHGIQVTDGSGTWTSRPGAVPLEDAPAADVVLVLVKSTQTDSPSVLSAVGRAAADGAGVLTLQNGLGNREALERAAGAHRVVVGVATLGATLRGPARVRSFPGEVALARSGQPALDAVLDALVTLLSRAGVPASTVADVDPLVWAKLAVNCALNPLTALTGLPNGALLEHPRLRTLLSRAAREVADVARAQGIRLAGDMAERAEAVAEATGGNRSSMLQDLERGVPSEIESLNGAVVAEAVRRRVPVPVNEWLSRSVRAREASLRLRSRLSA